MFVDVVTVGRQLCCVNILINLFSSFHQTSSKQIVCVFLTTIHLSKNQSTSIAFPNISASLIYEQGENDGNKNKTKGVHPH